jgi:hypothetical protein
VDICRSVAEYESPKIKPLEDLGAKALRADLARLDPLVEGGDGFLSRLKVVVWIETSEVCEAAPIEARVCDLRRSRAPGEGRSATNGPTSKDGALSKRGHCAGWKAFLRKLLHRLFDPAQSFPARPA